MKALLFGATGMVGQGVLRECLLDPDIESVLSIGRSTTGVRDAKLRELVHADLADLRAIEPELAGLDACFFCLGISSVGMDEAAYTRITHDYALAAATALARRSPGVTFVFVSGRGADSTGKGRVMWARVKGRTENALLSLPLRAAYAFRPAYIQPLHGIQSRTPLYRVLARFLAPLYPLWKVLFPRSVTTTQELARAMIRVARRGSSKKVLESGDISEAAGA